MLHISFFAREFYINIDFIGKSNLLMENFFLRSNFAICFRFLRARIKNIFSFLSFMNLDCIYLSQTLGYHCSKICLYSSWKLESHFFFHKWMMMKSISECKIRQQRNDSICFHSENRSCVGICWCEKISWFIISNFRYTPVEIFPFWQKENDKIIFFSLEFTTKIYARSKENVWRFFCCCCW